MDGSFCNQVLAQIMLFNEKYALKPIEEKKPFVKVLPKKLDEEVASLMVEGFGGVITKLTPEQYKYLSLEEGNQIKDDDYRY